MTSGETLPRDSSSHGARARQGQDASQARSGAATGVVVVAHGGQESSTAPTAAYQPAVLRMVPVAAAIRHALRGSGAVVRRPRFRLRGWNGAQASPVDDLTETLDEIAAAYGPVPVVLVGHSMGARAAMRAAGHPAVSAVAGLAPWLPPGEPPTGPPMTSRARTTPGPLSSAPGRSRRWPLSRCGTAIIRWCAARAYGTLSRLNSPAPSSTMGPDLWPPPWR